MFSLLVAQIVPVTDFGASGFGPITWPVVLTAGAYLVLLGMQFANLISLQRNHDQHIEQDRRDKEEIRKELRQHTENDRRHPSDAQEDARRIRELERQAAIYRRRAARPHGSGHHEYDDISDEEGDE